MKARILTIEDDLDFQKAIVKILEKEYSVHVASNVTEAKKILSTHDFDMLLIDVSLPDGDGFHVCDYLKEKSLQKDASVIFITGKADLDNKVRAFNNGADDYLLKPFDAVELLMRVKAKLR